MRASIVLDEGVAPTLLTLLQVALCGVKGQGEGQGAVESSSSTASISPVKPGAKKGEGHSWGVGGVGWGRGCRVLPLRSALQTEPSALQTERSPLQAEQSPLQAEVTITG